MSFLLRPMAENENFRLLFEDAESPVAKMIAALQADVNNESTPLDQLAIKRARLNGMRAVRSIVMQAHEAQLQVEREASVRVEEKVNRSHRSLPWLRSFRSPRLGNSLGRQGTKVGT